MKKVTRFLPFVLTVVTLLLAACSGTAAAPTANAGSGKVEPIPVAFIGTVDSIAGDQWVINGQTVTVLPDVLRDGPFNVGDQVKVEGVVNADGSFSVSRVEVPAPQDAAALPQFGDDNSNDIGPVDVNGNDANINDSNTNDGNINDANSNDDNSNTANTNDANTNDDNGNASNSNDDNSNSLNANDDSNINDDNGNSANSNDDNTGNSNSDDSNANDDDSNSGGNDNGGGDNGNGGGSDDSGGGSDDNGNGG